MNPETKRKTIHGCGCTLLSAGALTVVLAIIFAVAMLQADIEAGKKNSAEWDEYNQHLEQIDSMEKAGVADSIIAERFPRPIIRQGGFATLFGGAMALTVIAIAMIPITIGGIMAYKTRKKKDAIYSNELP